MSVRYVRCSRRGFWPRQTHRTFVRYVRYVRYVRRGFEGVKNGVKRPTPRIRTRDAFLLIHNLGRGLSFISRPTLAAPLPLPRTGGLACPGKRHPAEYGADRGNYPRREQLWDCGGIFCNATLSCRGLGRGKLSQMGLDPAKIGVSKLKPTL
jgi:hypothetical protein